MSRHLSIDFEVFCKLDLSKVGLSRYARHKSCEVLLCGWAFEEDDDEDVQLWNPAEGEEMPQELDDALNDPEVIIHAWNAQFERYILKYVLGYDIPIERFRCTMVLAYTLSLPGKLEKAGAVVGLPEDKKKLSAGKALIRRYCQPRTPTKKLLHTRNLPHHGGPRGQEKWETFKAYCRGDVVAERNIYRRIRKFDLPDHEWQAYFLDQRINDAGIPINMRAVENAIKISEYVVEKRIRRMAEITGLSNPNSNVQLLRWLQENGYRFEDLKKGHIEQGLKDAIEDSDDDRAEVLELRQEVSKASVKKYNALWLAVDMDNVLRLAFQFAGAGRTWRWAGRRFQAQNLARPVWWLEKCLENAVRHMEMLDPESIEMVYHKPMDLLSSCVRPVVQAPKGYVLLDADLAAIENVVLGWVTGDKKILRVFEENRDPYIDFATYMFKKSYDDLWEEYKPADKSKTGDKSKRTIAKPGVLGCGYRLGVGEERYNKKTAEIEYTGLLGYAKNMGVEMTRDEADHAVKTWRKTYVAAVDYWDKIERAVKVCIKTGKPTKAGPIQVDFKKPFLRLRMPSGRYLHYCRPRIEPKKTPWGETRPTITYEQMNDKNQWVRVGTHGGKLVENIVQAIARDLLLHGMMLADERGFDIRLHVHDQIVCLEKEKRAKERLQELIACMTELPPWCVNMPLRAAGHISKVFLKD